MYIGVIDVVGETDVIGETKVPEQWQSPHPPAYAQTKTAALLRQQQGQDCLIYQGLIGLTGSLAYMRASMFWGSSFFHSHTRAFTHKSIHIQPQEHSHTRAFHSHSLTKAFTFHSHTRAFTHKSRGHTSGRSLAPSGFGHHRQGHRSASVPCVIIQIKDIVRNIDTVRMKNMVR